tara:strand:+ start:176 stop:1846 length:1671 start_codon:yes stop_codon:yes gene_type:complete
MAHDLVIRDGLIVDGTGAAGFRGDVAIDGDTIAAVGKVDGTGTREINANGNAVTPGFVDLHTHFDAQAGWDPLLTPASWHGVTTALIGNCGVTFAPCKPSDQTTLAGIMETVEDIPKRAIMEGLAWDWESYGEYLDSIERLGPAINLAGLVGHCASRLYVMGEERAIEDHPTDDEVKQIADLVGRSIKEGAVGFSSNRLPGHVGPDGRSIPGTFAKPGELQAIARSVGQAKGILQFVLNYSNLADEMDLITAQAKEAGTRLLFSAPFNPGAEGDFTGYDKAIASMRADGVDVSGLTLPRSGGFLSGLKTDILFAAPAFEDLRKMDFDARLKAIRDDDFRTKLIDSARATPGIAERTSDYYYIGSADRPNYTKGREESLASIAKAAGEDPVETWLRVMDETNGEALFHVRFFNHNLNQVSEFLKADWILPGIGDAGAHVSQIMDSGWPSFLLAHWHRDEGLFNVEEAVRKMTSAQARVIGLTDRGVLAEGKRADINVIDLDRVAERQPKLVHDFPNGAPRLIQKAVGYEATVVNGAVMLEKDEHTGERAGQILRNRG